MACADRRLCVADPRLEDIVMEVEGAHNGCVNVASFLPGSNLVFATGSRVFVSLSVCVVLIGCARAC